MHLLHTLTTLWSFLDLKNRLSLFAITASMVLAGFLEMGSLAALFAYISILSERNGGLKSQLILHFYEKIVPFTAEANYALVGGIFLVAFFFIKNIAILLIDHLYKKFLAAHQKTLTQYFYAEFLNMPYENVKSLPHNKMHHTVYNIRSVFNNVFSAALECVTVLIIALMILGLLALLQPTLTLILLFFFGFSMFLINHYTHALQIAAANQIKEEKRFLYDAIKETSLASLQISMSNARPYFLERFKKFLGKNINAKLALETFKHLPYSLNEVLLSAALVITVIYFLAVDKNLNAVIPILAVFAFAGMRIVRLFSRMARCHQRIVQNREDLDELARSLNKKKNKKLLLKRQSIASVFSSQDRSPFSFKQRISAKNVSYAYPGIKKLIIRNLSLEIKKGGFIGICGPSGSGKSTLTLLLSGLIQPQKGDIKCDGKSIFDDQASWHSNVGLVPAMPYLSPKNVRENIAFGIPPDKIDDTRIWSLLKIVQLDRFVKSLPQSLETTLEAMGSEISDGQKQRLCIARALYNDPDILILDETLAWIDQKTESLIIRAIRKSYTDKTIICVSHRITSLRNTDIIYLIKDGKIKATGNYKKISSCIKDSK